MQPPGFDQSEVTYQASRPISVRDLSPRTHMHMAEPCEPSTSSTEWAWRHGHS